MRKKKLDTPSRRAYIRVVTRSQMTGAELVAMMDRAGLTGQKGAIELAARIGIAWRTVYRWRGDFVKITPMAETAIRQALATTQDRESRVSRAARKSNKTTKK